MSPTSSPTQAPSTDTPPTLPRAWRVEVFRREGVHDPEGAHAQTGLREAGAGSLTQVRAARGYLLPPDLDRADVERLVRELLADPVTDEARLIAPGSAPEPAQEGWRRVLVAPKLTWPCKTMKWL